MMRSWQMALVVTAGCLVSSVAWAQVSDEVVVATARAAKLPAGEVAAKVDDSANPTVKAANSPQRVIAWLANAPRLDRSETAAAEPAVAPGADTGGRTIHGTAGVSIGTGGYRSAYVTSLIPIGESGTLGLAYSTTDFGKTGGYGYRGYDGYTGYDGYGSRGGSMQSFGLSLDMNGDANGSDTPEGCAPGFRDRGRYVEPVWVTHPVGDTSCEAAERR